MARLQEDAIVAERLLAEVRSEASGAVTLFLGTVRDHHQGRRVLHLEYQAYAGMAVSEMERIEQRAVSRFGLEAAAVVHRTGRLEIGEVSVAVAVAAAHRAEAFEACRFIIDRLKETVPIWKKEFYEGGAEWIEGPGPRDQP